MSVKYFATTVFLLAGTAAMSVTCLAGSPQACVAGTPTPASYTWNFYREASQLLNGIQEDAVRVHDQADLLRATAMDFNLSWQSRAIRVAKVRKAVNDMAAKLCRLEVIRRVAAPWEQQGIDHAGRIVKLMDDNTIDTLAYLKANEGRFWVPTYREYVTNLDQESGQLAHSMKALQEYARVQKTKA